MTLKPRKIYKLLLENFGSQGWWPVDNEYHKQRFSDPRFEIIVGALLTQNTAWANVEKALISLKLHNSLTVKKIVETEIENLKTMIQPSGFFNQKARRLKILASYLDNNYDDDLNKFFNRELQEIRSELLSLNGIGPETADSILLYAGNYPVFVVDAYTKRVCKRLPINVRKESYDEIQRYFEEELQKDFSIKDTASVYKEMHALIVKLAKNYCRNKPKCNKCPIQNYCEFNSVKDS